MSEASARSDRNRTDGATTERDPEDLPLAPGPGGLPLVGSTFDLMRRPIEFLEDAAEHGDVVSYRLAGQRFTAVLHPEYVEQVLVDDHETFRRWSGEEWGDTFGGYASEGLLLSEGDQWRQQRMLLQGAFTPDRIESYAEDMVAETERGIDAWEDGDRIELREEMSSLTLAILARTLFDLDIEDRGDPVRRAAGALNGRANVENLSAFLPPWVPTPANRRLHRAMGDMEDLVEDLIAERRPAIDEGGDERDDLLSLLLAAETPDGSTLSEAEIRDQLITFLFAGHETTALALTYALHALGHHPEKRQRLREEVESVTGGDPPTLADLPDLAYTDRVITETLRLYPPSYANFREATETTEVGGYRVPEGSKVSVPQIIVHRDERFYDDPESFRPDRWTDDFEDELPEYAYFPFGGGPRHCIGMRFARMELKLALPAILAAVDLEPLVGPDLEFETALTLQPADPVEARIHRR